MKHDACLAGSAPLIAQVDAALFSDDMGKDIDKDALFHTKRSRLRKAIIEKTVSRFGLKLGLPMAPILMSGEVYERDGDYFTFLLSLKIPTYSQHLFDALFSRRDGEIMRFLKENAPALTAFFVFVCFCGAKQDALQSENVITKPDLNGFYFIDFENYFAADYNGMSRLIAFMTIFDPTLYDAEKDSLRLKRAALNSFDEASFDDMKKQIQNLTDAEILETVSDVTRPLAEHHPGHADEIEEVHKLIHERLLKRRDSLDLILSESLPMWLTPSRHTSATPPDHGKPKP